MRVFVGRLCAAVLAGGALLAAIGIAAEATGWAPGQLASLLPEDHQLGLAGASLEKRLAAALVAAALSIVAVGLAICALPAFGSARRWHALLGPGSAGGGLAIANRAVRAIVVHAASTIDAVRGCDVDIGQHRRGWTVDARLVVEPRAVMPRVRDELTRVVAEALAHQTGLRVHRLRLRMELDDGLRTRLR